MGDELYMFINICEKFVCSSKELRDAAALCGDDTVKQEMISFIIPEFNKMWARSEGIKLILESKDFAESKDFVIEEMKAVTKHNLEMAKKIKDKLGSLNWN